MSVYFYITIYCGFKKVATVILHTLCLLRLFKPPWLNKFCGYVGVGSERNLHVLNF